MHNILQQPRIIVVEGPAGSGKSTLIKKMQERIGEEGLVVVRSSLPRHDISDVGGVVGSSINDWQKSAQALLASGMSYGREMVMIDRLIVSQWVYHQIRTSAWTSGHTQLKPWFIEHFGTVRRDLYFRSGQIYLEPVILVVMVLPDIDEIVEQRDQARESGRHYDHHLGLEVDFYTEALDQLQRKSVNGLRYEDLSVVRYRGAGGVQDFDELFDRVCAWQWPRPLNPKVTTAIPVDYRSLRNPLQPGLEIRVPMPFDFGVIESARARILANDTKVTALALQLGFSKDDTRKIRETVPQYVEVVGDEILVKEGLMDALVNAVGDLQKIRTLLFGLTYGIGYGGKA